MTDIRQEPPVPTIVTRAQWGARPPRSRATITSWTRRVGVAVHHSATGGWVGPRWL